MKYSNLAARLDDPFQSSYYAVYDVTVPGMCVCDGKLESPVVMDVGGCAWVWLWKCFYCLLFGKITDLFHCSI